MLDPARHQFWIQGGSGRIVVVTEANCGHVAYRYIDTWKARAVLLGSFRQRFVPLDADQQQRLLAQYRSVLNLM